MHQIQVKRYLVEKMFSPREGWDVVVDVDAMELGEGNQNTQEKRDTAAAEMKWLSDNGATVHKHKLGKRTDIRATHPEFGTYVIECEGDTSKQREQAMYSALGQVLLQMTDPKVKYAIALPNTKPWSDQIGKIPLRIRQLLPLLIFMVGQNGVEII